MSNVLKMQGFLVTYISSKPYHSNINIYQKHSFLLGYKISQNSLKLAIAIFMHKQLNLKGKVANVHCY